jgi:hypothetical protein
MYVRELETFICVMAQAVLTAVARVSPFEMCVDELALGQCFLRVLSCAISIPFHSLHGEAANLPQSNAVSEIEKHLVEMYC